MGSLSSPERTESQRDILARLDGVVVPLMPASCRTVPDGMAVK